MLLVLLLVSGSVVAMLEAVMSFVPVEKIAVHFMIHMVRPLPIS